MITAKLVGWTGTASPIAVPAWMNYRYQGVGTKGQRHRGTKFFSFPFVPFVPALSVAYTTENRYIGGGMTQP